MIDDAELLRRYAENRSEPAFAELVQRHVNVVYAAALRRVGGDAHLAEEVAQNVFTILARKAGSLPRHPLLIGWLHRSTHYAAVDALRDKRRREQRELVGEIMNAKAETNRSRGAEVDWEEVRPVIDSLLDQLNERDRGALLLRFFEGFSFSQIGAALRLSEDAARMRVERALEKLRAALGRRGITSTTAALGVALANQAGAVAPAGVAASVTGAALAGGAVSGSASAVLAFLTMSKISIGVVSAIVVAVVATGVVELRANRELSAEVGALQAGGGDLGRQRKENERLNGELQKLGAANPEAEELARLRSRLAQLKARPEGVTDVRMKPEAQWKNAGRATPAAAYETFLWARLNGNLDVFAATYVFQRDAKAKADAFFAGLPEHVRAKFGTPERLFAQLFAPFVRDRPAAFQILGSTEEGFDRVMVHGWERGTSGKEGKSRAMFKRDGDGWRFGPVGPLGMVESAITLLDPTTGEPLPANK